MDANEVLSRYAAGEKDFRQLDLREISLIKANLSAVALSGTSLRNSSLSGSYLSNVNLNWASLKRANLNKTKGNRAIGIGQSMMSRHTYLCCSDTLLRHFRFGELYWRCSHCYQDMPVAEIHGWSTS
ncbi:pentapeptide repeat-containing protein [Chroococcidiopsis sp. CCMEE 29]|uniref:pentapeptide repeat-containing protein n=1 Tax=Chroococcidiopsis sp. CCMEE 29 TaxID=155894 RepID=UPI0020226F21|nr:pentapeptide repeat-containing protein [Chroococcidiopsis sp. CCMEE 29]